MKAYSVTESFQPTLFDIGQPESANGAAAYKTTLFDNNAQPATTNSKSHRVNGKPLYKSVIMAAYWDSRPKFQSFISWLAPLAEENIILDSLLGKPYDVQLEALKAAYEKLASAHLQLSFRAKAGTDEEAGHSYKTRYYNSIFGTLIAISKPPSEDDRYRPSIDLIKERLMLHAKKINLEREMDDAFNKGGHPVALALWIARKIATVENPKPDPQGTLF